MYEKVGYLDLSSHCKCAMLFYMIEKGYYCTMAVGKNGGSYKQISLKRKWFLFREGHHSFAILIWLVLGT